MALRIAVNFHVSVASAERSFSKLKLIKTYLRSTMTQHCLNGHDEHKQEFSWQLSYDDIIDNFAVIKSRRV